MEADFGRRRWTERRKLKRKATDRAPREGRKALDRRMSCGSHERKDDSRSEGMVAESCVVGDEEKSHESIDPAPRKVSGCCRR